MYTFHLKRLKIYRHALDKIKNKLSNKKTSKVPTFNEFDLKLQNTFISPINKIFKIKTRDRSYMFKTLLK